MKRWRASASALRRHPTGKTSSHRIGKEFTRCDESIALATMYTANHFPGVKAIIALTESGYTPLIMSRIRSSVPIYALLPAPRDPGACGDVPWRVHHSVRPGRLNRTKSASRPSTNWSNAVVVEQGDWVILTKGDSYHTTGGTNGMKILHVGDPMV